MLYAPLSPNAAAAVTTPSTVSGGNTIRPKTPIIEAGKTITKVLKVMLYIPPRRASLVLLAACAFNQKSSAAAHPGTNPSIIIKGNDNET